MAEQCPMRVHSMVWRWACGLYHPSFDVNSTTVNMVLGFHLFIPMSVMFQCRVQCIKYIQKVVQSSLPILQTQTSYSLSNNSHPLAINSPPTDLHSTLILYTFDPAGSHNRIHCPLCLDYFMVAQRFQDEHHIFL